MSSRTTTLIILSFLIIYVVWGSTYMFIAYVVEEIPPFTASCIRYSFAAFVLIMISLPSRQFNQLYRKEVLNSFFAGILMLGLGSGVVAWVLQYLDSGFTALLISVQPLIIVFMMWVSDKKRPLFQTFFGVFLGMIGVYLLVSQDEIVTRPDQWWAILALSGCLLSWSIGSIFISKAAMPKSFIANTSIQFFSGALFTGLVGFSLENPLDVDWFNLSHFTWYSLLYLAVFGAVLAFLAFNYLLKNVTPDKVSTATYINPIIALILGWWFRDELVTVQSIVAAAIMLTGVVLINFRLAAVRKGLYFLLPKKRAS